MSSVSCIRFFQEHLSAKEVTGKSVLEVGSYDINGSPRMAIEPLRPAKYVGVDRHAGKGVDKILVDLKDLEREFGRNSFDLVVSSEFLERVEDWKGTIQQMKRIVMPEGLVLLTVRAPGFPKNGHGGDRWRYRESDLTRIFGDFEILEIQKDPMAPGIFFKARKQRMALETDIRALELQEA